uniref:Putative secreted protein n=1 Tax=Anopheles triannulatus TaxID=58253 RepID=A0A2M4B3C8_9DIPT
MGAARTIITFTFLFSCSPSWSLIWIASEQADRSGNRSVVRLGNDSLHLARSRTEIHSQGRWGCGCETHTRVSVECELLQNINWEKRRLHAHNTGDQSRSNRKKQQPQTRRRYCNRCNTTVNKRAGWSLCSNTKSTVMQQQQQ